MVAAANLFFLNTNLSFCFLHSYTHIQHVLQRVFAHDLFKGKMIGAGFTEPGLGLNEHAVFIDIIHGTAQPSLVVGGQGKIVPSGFGCGAAGFIHGCIDPDIIVIIGIGMPQYKIDIVERKRIAYIEADLRLKPAFPLLMGDGNIFFKNTGCKMAGGKT